MNNKLKALTTCAIVVFISIPVYSWAQNVPDRSISEVQSSIDSDRQEIRMNEENISSAKSDIAIMKDKISGITLKGRELTVEEKAKLKAYSDDIKDANDFIEGIEKSNKEWEELIRSKRDEILSLRIEQEKNPIEKTALELRKLTDDMDRLEDKSDKLKKEIEDYQELPGLEDISEKELKSLKAELEKIDKEISKLKQSTAEKEAEYKALKKERIKSAGSDQTPREGDGKEEGATPTPKNNIDTISSMDEYSSNWQVSLDYVAFKNEIPGTGTSGLRVPPDMTEYFQLKGGWDVSGDGVEIGVNYNTGKPLPEGIDRKKKSSNVGLSLRYRYLTGEDSRSAQYNPGNDKVAFIYQKKVQITPGHYSTGNLLGVNSMTSVASIEYDERTFSAGFGWLCDNRHFNDAGLILNPFINLGYRDIETTTMNRDFLTEFSENFHAEDESRLDTMSLTGNIGAKVIIPATRNLSFNFKSELGVAYNDADLKASQSVSIGNAQDVNININDDKSYFSPEFKLGIGVDYNFTEKFTVSAGVNYEYRDAASVEKIETGDGVLDGGSTSIGTEGTNNINASFGAWFFF